MYLAPQDKELYRRIDEVAFYIWDPIGVSDLPGVRDEYESYVWGLFAQVRSNELNNVVKYMESAVTESMGMIFDRPTAIRAAQIMLEWNQILTNQTNT